MSTCAKITTLTGESYCVSLGPLTDSMQLFKFELYLPSKLETSKLPLLLLFNIRLPYFLNINMSLFTNYIFFIR